MLVLISSFIFSSALGVIFVGVLPTGKGTFYKKWHKE